MNELEQPVAQFFIVQIIQFMSHTTTSTLVAQTDCIAATVKKSSFQQSRNPLYLAYRCGEKVARKFGSFKTIADICNAVHTKGEENSQIKRVFFILVYIGSILPCRCLMARLPFVGVQQRVGIEPFLHIVNLS